MHITSDKASQSMSLNAGLAAFEVAVVQQQEFQETLERVSEKQIEATKDQERKVEESRARQAEARGGVDVVVRDDTNDTADSGDSTIARGGSVDVAV